MKFIYSLLVLDNNWLVEWFKLINKIKPAGSIIRK